MYIGINSYMQSYSLPKLFLYVCVCVLGLQYLP